MLQGPLLSTHCAYGSGVLHGGVHRRSYTPPRAALRAPLQASDALRWVAYVGLPCSSLTKYIAKDIAQLAVNASWSCPCPHPASWVLIMRTDTEMYREAMAVTAVACPDTYLQT